LRCTGLGLLGLHLGTGRFPLGLGAVERTLADVLLLEELLLTLQLFAGHVQVGLRGFELGAAARPPSGFWSTTGSIGANVS
jgi:hypothetical protein